MKAVIIDANVVHAYFFEVLHGHAHPERTASAVPLVDELGHSLVAFVDEGGQVESEWRNVVSMAAEFFSEWLANAYISGAIYQLETKADAQLRTRYQKAGFPCGRDLWYVRVASELTKLCKRNRPSIIAEDIDFFDPTKKAAGNKLDTFKSGTGQVADQLRSDGIDVYCLLTFFAGKSPPVEAAAA